MMEIPVELNLRVTLEVRPHCCPNRLEDIVPAFSCWKNMPARDISTSIPIDTRLCYAQDGLFVHTKMVDELVAIVHRLPLRCPTRRALKRRRSIDNAPG